MWVITKTVKSCVPEIEELGPTKAIVFINESRDECIDLMDTLNKALVVIASSRFTTVDRLGISYNVEKYNPIVTKFTYEQKIEFYSEFFKAVDFVNKNGNKSMLSLGHIFENVLNTYNSKMYDEFFEEAKLSGTEASEIYESNDLSFIVNFVETRMQ